jgi:hypothetical protein
MNKKLKYSLPLIIFVIVELFIYAFIRMFEVHYIYIVYCLFSFLGIGIPLMILTIFLLVRNAREERKGPK